MKRTTKKSLSRATGKQKGAPSRRRVDKSLTDKQLPKRRGKELRHQSTPLNCGLLPVEAPTSSQESTQCRLRAPELLALIDLEVSRRPVDDAHAHRAVHSTEGDVVNTFRTQLSQLTRRATTDPVSRDLLAMLDLATKQFFLGERTFLRRELFATVVEPRKEWGLQQVYSTLVASGRIQTALTGLGGRTESPFAFDLHAEKPFHHSTNLLELVDRFMETNTSPSTVSAIYQAIRVISDLPACACRSAIRAEAKLISDQHFFSLPAALRRRCESASLSKKTRQNLVSAMRHLLAWGLTENHFALYFPPHRPADAWNIAVDECFPLVANGRTPRQVLHARSALFSIVAMLRDEVSVARPEDATPQHIGQCMALAEVPHRELERLRIRRFTQVEGKCPGNFDHPLMRLIIDTLRALRSVPALPYLGSGDLRGEPENSLDGLSAIARRHQLPGEWGEFFSWYWQYSTLPHVELRRRSGEFPARGAKRRLREMTFAARIATARAMLGIAQQLFPERFPTLTPTEVFGELFEPLVLELMERWDAGASTERGPSHGASAGVVHHVLAAGLIARALFDRSRHTRSMCHDLHDTPPGSLPGGSAPSVWLSGQLNAAEATLLRAYEISRQDASELQSRARTSPRGTKSNTIKDLRQLIRDTPFVHFQKAQLWILKQVETMRELNLEDTHDYRVWVVTAVIHGLLLSSGCRRSELCHIRLGVHTDLLAGSRLVKLRPVDRKNNREHEFIARDRWLPDWLLSTYRDAVRPHLLSMAGLSEDGTQFLILNPHTGRPYGCLEENVSDGSGRAARPMSHRRAQLARLWRIQVAKAFVACEFTVPAGRQRFGLHVVRNVGGHAVFLRYDLATAAAWLGDRVSTIEGVYASLSGEQVDTSLVI